MVAALTRRLQETFSVPRLAEVLGDAIVNILLASIVFASFFVVWLVVRNVMTSRFAHRIDKTSSAMLLTAFKLLILGVGVIAALNAAGLQTATLLTSLGVLSLTLGFALRDTLSNVIAGLLIFIDRPFTIDDLVEIDGQYGRVARITLRTTRIVTTDGRMLAVPNNLVMNKTVTSYTNFPNLRLDVGVTVGVEEDLNRIRQILLDMVGRDPDYLQEPAPRLVVAKLNDYNVALELQAWLKNERDHTQKRFALREEIYMALTAAGVSMPLETIQLAPHRIELTKPHV